MAEYLAVKDVAKMLLVSERTVFRWIRLGRIHPARIGRTLRFEKSRLLIQLEKFEYGGEADDDFTLG